jgi:hypothetical protein
MPFRHTRPLEIGHRRLDDERLEVLASECLDLRGDAPEQKKAAEDRERLQIAAHPAWRLVGRLEAQLEMAGEVADGMEPALLRARAGRGGGCACRLRVQPTVLMTHGLLQ